MTPFEVYSQYLAVKRHFYSDKYNYFVYGGKTNATESSFLARKDKQVFFVLSKRLKDAEVVPFLVANFVFKDCYVMELLDQEAMDRYTQWQKTIESMEYRFALDCKTIVADKGMPFMLASGQTYPEVVNMWKRGEISLETLVIFNNLFHLVDKWDKVIQDDLVWPNDSRLIRKYGAFLTITDISKYRAIFVAKVKEHDGDPAHRYLTLKSMAYEHHTPNT